MSEAQPGVTLRTLRNPLNDESNERLRAHVEKIAADAPPIPDSARARLCVLLAGGDEEA